MPRRPRVEVRLRDIAPPVRASFASDRISVPESVGDAVVTVVLSETAASDVSLNWEADDVSAKLALDFGPTHGTLIIPSGQLSGEIVVPVFDDAIGESSETFKVTLSYASGATLLPPTVIEVEILDDDYPTVAFTSATYSAEEAAETATITVALSAPMLADSTVDWTLHDGSATQGADYQPATGTVTFLEGHTTGSFDVDLFDDSDPEPEETVLLLLSNPVGPILGLQDTATLTILDDDSPPTVAFESDALEAQEVDGIVTATIRLSRVHDQDVTVHVASEDDTATSPEDFEAVSQLVRIPAGQPSATVDVTIINDTDPEGQEKFALTLEDPTEVDLGTPESVIITILESDSPNTVRFTESSLQIHEDGGTVTLGVQLDHAASGTESVLVTSTGGSADSGVDFEPINETITFAVGEKTRTVNVVPKDEATYEPAEDFSVNLSAPSGGAVLGSPSTVIVTILNSDWRPHVFMSSS